MLCVGESSSVFTVSAFFRLTLHRVTQFKLRLDILMSEYFPSYRRFLLFKKKNLFSNIVFIKPVSFCVSGRKRTNFISIAVKKHNVHVMNIVLQWDP